MSKVRPQIHNKSTIRDDSSGLRKNQGFISFSHYLRKKQEAEMKIMQKLDYNYTGHKETTDMQGEMLMFMKYKDKDQNRKTIKNNNQKTLSKKIQSKNSPRSGTESKQYQQIDSEAVVINNKLIYLKEEPSSIPTNDHLLHLLKQNNLSNKDYLVGKKQEILAQITQNQSQKENQIIRDYILRNMNEQNNGEVVVMDRFYQVKHQLFS